MIIHSNDTVEKSEKQLATLKKLSLTGLMGGLKYVEQC